MNEILAKLNTEQPFETIAESYSESSLAAESGDLGLFVLTELSPQIQEYIKDMKAGEFTPVLDTSQGYQIIFVQEVVKTPDKPLEEVSAEIEKILYNEVLEKKFLSWLEDLRSQAVIKIIK